jgi:thioredoxin-like negative regulator of GroEL
MAPVLEELASHYAGRVKFAILNVDENRAVAGSYNVTGVPALFFYSRGRLVDRAVGGLPKPDIEHHIQTLIQPV